MIQQILIKPHNILSTVSSDVTDFTEAIRICRDLKDTLKCTPTGIGLAANQIGETKRIFVLKLKQGYKAYINPRIIAARGKQILMEGCLSVPNVVVKRERNVDVKLLYQNEQGMQQFAIFTGVEAQAVQHEVDHLNGVTL